MNQWPPFVYMLHICYPWRILSKLTRKKKEIRSRSRHYRWNIILTKNWLNWVISRKGSFDFQNESTEYNCCLQDMLRGGNQYVYVYLSVLLSVHCVIIVIPLSGEKYKNIAQCFWNWRLKNKLVNWTISDFGRFN